MSLLRFNPSSTISFIRMIHSLPRITAPQSLQVNLTDTEQSVCELLDQCATYLKQEKQISTTCRIAGGWVRDKVKFQAVQLVYSILHTISYYHSYLDLRATISMSLSVISWVCLLHNIYQITPKHGALPLVLSPKSNKTQISPSILKPPLSRFLV